MTRTRCGRIVVVLVLALAAPRLASAVTAEQQEAQNKRWLSSAEKRQRDYYDKGQRALTRKQFKKATSYFKKCLNVTYSEWQFGKSRDLVTRSSGSSRRTPKAPALRKARKRLKTSVNRRARDKLEEVKEKYAEHTLKTLTDQAEKAEQAKKPAAAYGLYARVARLAGNSKKWSRFRKQAEKKGLKIRQDAAKILDQADKALNAGQFDEAVNALEEFEAIYGEFKEAKALNDRLTSMSKAPEVVAVLRKRKAQKMLDATIQALDAGRFLDAYEQFAVLQEIYPATEPGREGARRLAEMKKDETLMKAVKAQQDDRFARKLLYKAQGLVADGKRAEAMAVFERIAREFADTAAAADARKELEKSKSR